MLPKDPLDYSHGVVQDLRRYFKNSIKRIASFVHDKIFNDCNNNTMNFFSYNADLFSAGRVGKINK